MLGKPFLLARARLGYMKVRDMPILNHQSEGTGSLEPLELPQTFDGKDVRRIQLLLLTRQLFVRLGFVAQVEKSRYDPYPRRSYATAGTATVVGHPSCVNRLSKATRTCNSVT